MEITYTPNCCRDGRFTGTVKLKVPSFDERFQFIEDCGLDVGDDGGLKKSGGNFSIIRNMVKASEKFYLAVDMTKADGAKFNSFESLSMDPDCDEVLIEVAKEIKTGFRPSPKSSES